MEIEVVWTNECLADLVEFADSLLTFDVFLIVCKHLKPATQTYSSQGFYSKAIRNVLMRKVGRGHISALNVSNDVRQSRRLDSCSDRSDAGGKLYVIMCTGRSLSGSSVLSPIVLHQHADEVFEEVRLAGAEEASRYLIHCLLQLWDTVVVRHGVIAEDKIH